MLSLESQRVFQNLVYFFFPFVLLYDKSLNEWSFGDSEFCFPQISETKFTVPLGTSHLVLNILLIMIIINNNLADNECACSL